MTWEIFPFRGEQVDKIYMKYVRNGDEREEDTGKSVSEFFKVRDDIIRKYFTAPFLQEGSAF